MRTRLVRRRTADRTADSVRARLLVLRPIPPDARRLGMAAEGWVATVGWVVGATAAVATAAAESAAAGWAAADSAAVG